MGFGSEVRGRRAVVGGRKSEVGGQKSEVGGQRRRAEFGVWKSEVGGQKSEVGGWTTEIRNEQSDPEKSVIRNCPVKQNLARLSSSAKAA
jgi:hypothetical protein